MRVSHSVSLAMMLGLSADAVAQAGSIAGRVADARTGVAVVGARVDALGYSTRGASTITGDSGQFVLGRLAPGLYSVVVVRMGQQARRIDSVLVRAGTTSRVDVAMTAIATNLDLLVTSASRYDEKVLDAPASVTTITQQAAAARPSLTVADHVKASPGVDVSTGGIVQSNVVARGFNNAFSTRLLTLRDYRFAAVPSLGVNAPFLVPGASDDVERIELVLGPAAALYGPNAASGVMHVLTRSPFDARGTSATLDVGSRDILRASVRHAQVWKNMLGVKVSAESMTGQDWHYDDPGEPDSVPHGTSYARRDYSVNRNAGEVRVDYRPTDGIAFVTSYGVSRVGSAIDITGATGAVQAKRWTYQSVQQRVNWGRLFAQAFINTSWSGNADSLDTRGTFSLRSGLPIVDRSRVAAANLQHGSEWGTRLRFTYGADYIWTNPRTEGTINGRNEGVDDMHEAGAYVHSVMRLDRRWDLVSALRVDGSDLLAESVLLPRIGVVFKPAPSQNVRLTFNRAYISPRNFEHFLDLVQLQNPAGLPYTIRAMGNPPDQGWLYARMCPAALAGGLCMRSPFASDNGTSPNAYVAADAAAYYRTALAVVGPMLPASVQPLVPILQALNPTSTQVGSQLRFLGSSGVIDPSTLRNIEPLEPNFVNHYEAGYKGTLGLRARLSVDLWHQEQINFVSAPQAATPNVFLDPASLGVYLNQQIAAALTAQGMPAAQAQATADAAAPALASGLAEVPVGTIAFLNGPQTPDIIYTYRVVAKSLEYSGADVGVDFLLTDRWSVGANYSYVNKGTFPGIETSPGLPLRLNAPRNKGALSLTYGDDTRGRRAELRLRHTDAFAVNSGVYATGATYPYGGQTGAFYTYPSVPTRTLLDAGFTARVWGSRDKGLWSINVTNLLNSPAPTFIGVPSLGRMVMTRVQYTL